MRRHPSWDDGATAPQVPPATSTVSTSRREFQDLMSLGSVEASLPLPRAITTRSRSVSDETHAVYAGFESARRLAPGRISRSTVGTPLARSPFDGSVYCDSSSQSSRASSAIRNARGTQGSSSATNSTSAVGAKVKKKRVRLKTERRREQCRRNQARYRNKQKFSAIQLEDAVEHLRHEVEALQHQHTALYCAPRSHGSSARVVQEFYELFRFGLDVGREQSTISLAPRPWPQPPSLAQQVAHVTSAYHSDLLVGDARGRTLILEQMRRYTTLFDNFELVLDRLACVSDPETVQTSSWLDLTVTTTTIRHVFPHLVRAEHRHIRWKLLGQRLHCAASAALVFDDHGQVVEVNWTIDFVEALQHVLTIEETAVVLQHAQIERDAFLIASGEDASDQHGPLAASVEGRHRTSWWDERRTASTSPRR